VRSLQFFCSLGILVVLTTLLSQEQTTALLEEVMSCFLDTTSRNSESDLKSSFTFCDMSETDNRQSLPARAKDLSGPFALKSSPPYQWLGLHYNHGAKDAVNSTATTSQIAVPKTPWSLIDQRPWSVTELLPLLPPPLLPPLIPRQRRNNF
jgi:hypothetical protein